MKTLISQIIATIKHHVTYVQGNGFPYPLLKIEDEVWNITIAMSKCHHTIRASNELQLINDLISKTQYQMKLNSFKGQRCGLIKEDGKAIVLKGYLLGFMKCNGHMFNHVRHQKIGLDRTDWW